MPGATGRRWRGPVVVLLPLLLAVACGGGDEEESGAEGGGQATKVAKIGVIAPLSGDLTATGTGIRNSVELAIRQANEQNKVPGWRIELAAEDDAAKPDVGAQAAAKLASDAAVIGVVGTYNSSVALQVAPVLERANIVQVSPANTNDTLTRGESFRTNPTRPHKNYFRTATLDSLQGGFAADYATRDLNFRTAAIIHDKKAYGQGLADSFRAQFERNGGRVVATETINPGDKDFAAVLTKIRPLNPDLIFYGGEYPEGSLISSQAHGAQGIRAPVMGGDGIVDPTYTKTAGNAANGDFGTSVGAPPEQLPSARQFITDYQRAGFRDPYTAYGALAYDAANAIITTLPAALGSARAVNDEVRRKVLDAVGKVSFDGASGRVAFDAFGDTVTKTLTMYKVENGEFKPVKSGEFRG
ncbi:MAG TPA: branched-chain amino acid ABC transporter substrate-binding protein [Acidimicrobiales bacterium]|nr:branched-chain amino acid ABC transporter substrate-binding protein [Acidimicrobiales bacterium]